MSVILEETRMRIAQMVNDICHQLGGTGDNFTQNIEMWEFSAMVDEALEGVDYIDKTSFLNSLCPKVSCMLDKMMNTPSSNFVCKLSALFEGFEGSNSGLGYPLLFTSSECRACSTSWTAFTTYNQQSRKIIININPENCNQFSLIDIYETIQHELVHANILQNLLNAGWNGTSTALEIAFYEYVNHIYGPNSTPSQHRYMLDNLLVEMINSLIEANNGIGTYEDFEGFVLNSFGQDLLLYCEYSLEEINDKMTKYSSFISNHNNIGSFFKSCQ